MNRSQFTKTTLLGTLALLGCNSHQPTKTSQTSLPRSQLKFHGLPRGVDLIASILLQNVFHSTSPPPPTTHPERLPMAPGENRSEWQARFRIEQIEYARRIREAQNHFENWNLAPDDYDSLERLTKIQRQQARDDLKILHQTEASPGHVVSLDLTGVRLNLSPGSFADPDARFSEGPAPFVSPESLREIIKLRSLRRLFLNYTTCPFPILLELINQHGEFEALGLPNNLTPAQLEALLSDRSIDILDMSGYETHDSRDQLVSIAIRNNVRWLMFTSVDFDSTWMNVDWTTATDSFRGVIKLRSIGVLISAPIPQ